MKVYWLLIVLFPCAAFAQSPSTDFAKYAESLRNRALSEAQPKVRIPTTATTTDRAGPQVTVPGTSPQPARPSPKSFDEFFDGDTLLVDLFKVYPQWEDAIRKLDAKLNSSAILLQATVLNISDNGVLVKAKAWRDAKPSQAPDMVLRQPVFIYDAPDWLIDGSEWKVRIYPVGRYQYIAIDGSRKTVLAMAVTKQMAIRLMALKK